MDDPRRGRQQKPKVAKGRERMFVPILVLRRCVIGTPFCDVTHEASAERGNWPRIDPSEIWGLRSAHENPNSPSPNADTSPGIGHYSAKRQAAAKADNPGPLMWANKDIALC